MDYNAYQNSAAEFAIYPGRGQYTGFLYTVLGLCGEAGELQEKVVACAAQGISFCTPEARVDVFKELGDVMWYVSQNAWELSMPLSSLMALAPSDTAVLDNLTYVATRIVILSTKVAEQSKKLMRDFGGYLKPSDKHAFATLVREIAMLVGVLCSHFGVTVETVCNLNIEKLTSRKARNVIGGAGDNR